MTSLAFILGVVPLAFSVGAGAGARQSVGTGVMGGMMAATFLAIFFVPLGFKLLTDRQVLEQRTTSELQGEVEHHKELEHKGVHTPHIAPRLEPDHGGD
jgi:hypothetical protein